MPGERTPDTSTTSSPGSSDDEISLREHMQRQLDTQGRYFERLHNEQGQYFERVIADMWTRLDERFDAQQRGVDELKSTTAAKFESVNEQRGQLHDQATTFMRRDESLSRHDRSTEMIAALGQRLESEVKQLRDRFEAENKQLRDRHESDMAVVNSRLDLTAGQSRGVDKAWGFIVAGAGLLATIVGLVAYAIGQN